MKQIIDFTYAVRSCVDVLLTLEDEVYALIVEFIKSCSRELLSFEVLPVSVVLPVVLLLVEVLSVEILASCL